ncbi:MAG: sugar ABC transporter permease [Alicyclobacillaceae bacterium]|uniref:carbohydrate ABC transporter permease n=1 Tax=Alicyclobacillus sp. SP_1 TaxID=2942475 RepID=UPI0021587393|nr:sugar ABC transporter permease [Alicyclobacillus sp. SP_1]MCY0889087.1 sugar ABC transporter permease [Alicyclobacillaceae bacterium]
MSLAKPGTVASKRKPVFSFRAKNEMAGWLFVLPTLILVGVFGIGAILYVLYLSLLQWNLISPIRKFVGLRNYVELLHDSGFLHAFLRTMLYLLGTTGITVPLALFIAVLIAKKFHGARLFRTVFFVPYVVPTVASAVTWSWLFNSNFGFVNVVFRWLGLPPQPFLNSFSEALFVIILLYVWQFTGYFVVLFVNGLQGVPQHLYEAADVDGASAWQKFWRITLPMISPTTFFVLTVSLIFSFLSFDQIYVLTEGGPANSTTTLIYYLFEQGFQFFHIGLASAMSIVLLLLLLTLTYLQFRGESKWVHHQM